MSIRCLERRANSLAQRWCDPVKKGSTRQILNGLGGGWFCGDTLVVGAAASTLLAAALSSGWHQSALHASSHVESVSASNDTFYGYPRGWMVCQRCVIHALLVLKPDRFFGVRIGNCLIKVRCHASNLCSDRGSSMLGSVISC